LLEVVQTQTSNLATDFTAIAGADFSTIGSSNTAFGTGVTRTVYVTVGSGTRTLFKITGGNRRSGRSELNFTERAEQDDYEPNPSRDAAAAIPLNTDVQAQFWVPYTSSTDKSPSDFYIVDLEAGSMTFRLLSTPTNLRYAISLIPLGEGSTKVLANTTLGSTGSWSSSIATAGKYAVSLVDLNKTNALFVTPADHLTASYSFRIEQE
jgi:hypothetical protein